LTSQPLTAAQRLTIRSMLANTFQREGLRGLYHGIGPTLVGIVPYAGLKFYVYQVRAMRSCFPADHDAFVDVHHNNDHMLRQSVCH
jgi:solute carrier family 25 protein 16